MASVLTQAGGPATDMPASTQISPEGTPATILFLSPSAQLGGAERVLLDVIATLREANRARRMVVICSGNGPLVDEARRLGVSVIVLPFPTRLASLGDAALARSGKQMSLLLRATLSAPGVLRYLYALRRSLRQSGPDVIHSNGAKMHLLAAFAGHGIAPVVWHLHDYVSPRPFMRRALRACVSRCSAVLANSASVSSDARQVFGAGTPIHTVLNGVDLQRCAATGPRQDLDAAASLPPAGEGVVRIGMVGTFAKWKGHDVFFRALATLPSDLRIRAYVIGGPLYETRDSQHSIEGLRNLAAAMSPDVEVAFTGHVSDVPAAMRALDVVVHASTEPEPYGLAIAEAMACGRPLVTSGSGGALELVQHGDDGLVTPAGDACALGVAIERLVRDPALRARLGAMARKTAEHRFDRHRMAEALAPIYAKIAGAQSA